MEPRFLTRKILFLPLVVFCVLLMQPYRSGPGMAPGLTAHAQIISGPGEETNAPCPSDPVGQLFPSSNPWNTDISALPVLSNSDDLVASIGASASLHPDFGTVYEGAPWGIPFIVVDGSQPYLPVNFTAYGDESDPGPYPIPLNAPVEASGDRHVLAFNTSNRFLYELYAADPQESGWDAQSGAVFDTATNLQRPPGWTSADAAGLPILAGLARYEEVQCGAIHHALRFTARTTRRAYIYPANHYASRNTDPNVPAMGQRFRLKSSFDISSFSPQAQIILQALKTYGMMVSDNGGNWYISGAPNANWNDADIDNLKQVHGSDFEAVDTSSLQPPTDTVEPAGPTDLVLSAVSSTQIEAAWTAATDDAGVVGYRITLSKNPDFSDPLPAYNRTFAGNAETRLLDDLEPATQYYVRVVAYDEAGNASNGAISSATSQDPSVLTRPILPARSVVNGASFRAAAEPGGAIAPGAIVSLFGTDLATATGSAASVPLPTSLQDTSVTFNGIAAPLFSVSGTQINTQVPFELQPGEVSVQVARGEGTSDVQTATLAATSPGIFALNQRGTGQGAVLIANTAILAAPSGSVPGREARPADRLDLLSIFCTGLGDVTNRPPSGESSQGNGLSVTTETPTVTIGGAEVPVIFSGLSAYVGLYQVDVQITSRVPAGDAIPVVLTIGGVTSNTVTIAVQ